MAPSRKPTMADVAARAQVSLSTVSLTYSGAGPISPKMKEKVEKAARELGYGGPSPAGRSLRSGRTRLVGVIISENLVHSFRDPNSRHVMDGLVSSLNDEGLGLVLVPAPTGEEDSRPLVETAPMDAAVVMRVRDQDDPVLATLQQRGIPVVVMEGPAPKGAGSVTLDDVDATVQLIRHLQDLGHERIGTVTLQYDAARITKIHAPGEPGPAFTPTLNRLKAFDVAGVEPCVVVEAAATMVEEGIAAGHLALTHESKPTAIIAQSDLLAAGVLIAARELEISVPQDLSVTGFDGLDLPWLSPHELTTIVQDAQRKGRLLADEVKALLAGETPAPLVVPLEMRVGTTTGRAPR